MTDIHTLSMLDSMATLANQGFDTGSLNETTSDNRTGNEGKEPCTQVQIQGCPVHKSCCHCFNAKKRTFLITLLL